MRYWWVNQNQTYRHEFAGGYLWSPKRKANGQSNPYYEFMREVAPGDLVFSFADTRIGAFGIARSYAYEAPKPPEFGSAGRNWDNIGWRVDVPFSVVAKPFRPADWIDRLRPLLPKLYSPILADGRGVQSIYLTAVPRELALVLADLIGTEVGVLARNEVSAETVTPEHPVFPQKSELVLWEEHLRQEIERDPSISTTEKEALVLARRGQGRLPDQKPGVQRRAATRGSATVMRDRRRGAQAAGGRGPLARGTRASRRSGAVRRHPHFTRIPALPRRDDVTQRTTRVATAPRVRATCSCRHRVTVSGLFSGRTCSVFRKSTTLRRSDADSARYASRAASASPP